MTAQQFVEKWRSTTLSEKAASHQHFVVAQEDSMDTKGQVYVVYSGRGGIPRIEYVSPDRDAAARAHRDVMARCCEELTASEAAAWKIANPHFTNSIEEVNGRFYLVHTDYFDLYVDTINLDQMN